MKEHEGAEDDRLVDAVELSFQRAQAERVTVLCNGFINEQSGRGGADAGRLQNGSILFGFHKKWMLIC